MHLSRLSTRFPISTRIFQIHVKTSLCKTKGDGSSQHSLFAWIVFKICPFAINYFWNVSNRNCVKEWEEPHDCALYCIQTDGNHMIASGSSHYGVVRFWDKRQTKCLQVRTVPAHKCDVRHGNTVVTSCRVCCSTSSCVLSPCPALCTAWGSAALTCTQPWRTR